jgi:hypothetical protein
MTEPNTNSRKIRIKRAGSFLSRSQGKEVDEYYGTSVQNIGSYWESSNAKRIASGLTLTEEKILLPDLLGVHKEDRDYNKLRDEFYAALEVKVPYKDGVELEIALNDNTKPLSADNLPIDIHQYIRYRFARKHPWVGESEELAKGNQLKHFYIHDDVSATASKSDTDDIKDEALAYFLQIKGKADKVNMMLTLLGVDYRDVTGQTDKQTEQLRVTRLRSLLDTDAVRFKKLHEDRDFDVKYTIQMLLNTNVLRQIGQKILETETGDSIGTMEETVQFFKDEAENSDRIAVLKAKLQEATKAGRKNKRTVSK